ncbi:hypothetical protein M9434_004684 [Picochlorum sp. BPE23]|nr:hypothetical protein M9434_004684 [Picochlorum sp. BPE23]
MSVRRGVHSLFCIFPAIFLLFIAYNLRYNGRDGKKNVSYRTSATQFELACETCAFLHDGNNVHTDVKMTSFRGVGRTGNYMRAMRKAIQVAFICKKTIELPMEDDVADALPIESSQRFLDFSNRHGDIVDVCGNLKFPMQGNARFFWDLTIRGAEPFKISKNISFLAHEEYRVNECIKNYLGICRSDFCAMQNMERSTLVAHVREADVFRKDFTSVGAKCYGQPPLAYYIRAIEDQKWENVIIVGQPGSFGPLRSALSVLNQTGLFRETTVLFQSKSWSEDLRTLLCAENLVFSRSSLIPFLQLGFSRRFYTYSCAARSSTKESIVIPIEDYPYWGTHDGGPEEWSQVILHSAQRPQNCQNRNYIPKEPARCLPMWLNTSLIDAL